MLRSINALAPSEQLCELCRAIPFVFFQKKSTYKHQPSYGSLKASAQHCPLCAILFERLRSSSFGGVDVFDSLRRQVFLIHRRDGVEGTEPDIYVQLAGAEMLGWASDDIRADFLPYHGSQKVINHQPYCDEIVEQALYWINDCLQNHKECSNNTTNRGNSSIPEICDIKNMQLDTPQRVASSSEDPRKEDVPQSYVEGSRATMMNPRDSASPKFTPSRVIDVGPSDGIYEPRLCMKSSLPAGEIQYLALSHCWGEIPEKTIIKTTESTLSSHLQSIPLSSMPQTFRDAVIFTRRLGVRFLWIDSLCIIQGSKSDWEVEYPLMGRVYSNAFCTLVASGSKNSAGGMFVERNLKKTQPCVLTWSSETGVSNGVVIYPYLPAWETAITCEPVASRGWTMQERELSTRILHFTSTQLLWECRVRIASECDPNTTKWNRGGVGHTFGRWRLFDRCHWFNDHGANKGSLGILDWYTMVQDYSQRKITNPNDKLPAISGLASQFQLLGDSSDEYLAGLWKSDIFEGLLWYGTDSALGVPRAIPLRAPSWSWASGDGPVSWPLLEFEQAKSTGRPVIEQVYTQLASSDPMGQVLGGAVILTGCLMQPVVRYEMPHALGEFNVFRRDRYLHFTIYNELFNGSWDGTLREMGSMTLDDGADGIDLEVFFVLKMLEQKDESNGRDSKVRCLALVPENRHKGGSKRIGTALISSEWKGWFDKSPLFKPNSPMTIGIF